MTVSSVEALELSQILGSLLASVVDAQAQSARATVDFVQQVGFESTPAGDRLRYVTVRYSKKDEDGQPAEFEVEVPLLAMVNVPSLAVKDAKLTFSYDVVSTASPPAPSSPPASTPTTASAFRVPVARITGFVRKPPAPSSSSDKRTTAIDLEVTLQQQEVPVGIERLFDLAELGIKEQPTSGGGGGP